MEGKNYDFTRTLPDEATANHVLKSVLEEYKNHPKWKIGSFSIEPLPNGEYRVFVELKFYELGKKETEEESAAIKM